MGTATKLTDAQARKKAGAAIADYSSFLHVVMDGEGTPIEISVSRDRAQALWEQLGSSRIWVEPDGKVHRRTTGPRHPAP